MVKIGMITPSSNTVLEPVTYRMLADLPGVTAHFSRFVVREIALSDSANKQFSHSAMTAAANLLADADVDLIVWNGTSASWLGLEHDHELCRMIEEETGIQATTSSLAIVSALETLKAKRIGLVTPYTEDVNARIRRQYESLGFQVLIERASGIVVNKDFANVPEEDILRMLEETAGPGIDAAAVVCTNFHAAPLAAKIEENGHTAVADSVSATLWHSLKLLGISAHQLAGRWGRLFLH